MTNGFRGLLVGLGEPIYVKLKEVEKLAVRHFKKIISNSDDGVGRGLNSSKHSYTLWHPSKTVIRRNVGLLLVHPSLQLLKKRPSRSIYIMFYTPLFSSINHKKTIVIIS